jgi:hypothetical protein
MPVIQATGYPCNENPTGEVPFHRKLFVTDKDGVEHEITSPVILERILAQMTPEQLEAWKARYRFAPIQNLTGNPNYMGTIRDIL